MGWWNTNTEGISLLSQDSGMYWGDAPADVLDAAIQEICDIFVEVWGRKPTMDELIAGMRFSGSAVCDE